MTYNEIFFNSKVILNNIPLGNKAFTFSPRIATSVLLMQVSYDQKVKEYNEFMQEALAKLKKEGFDERSRKVNTFKDVDRRMTAYLEWKEGDSEERPSKPNEQELEAAKEGEAILAEFETEMKELELAYEEAATKKSSEEVKDFNKKLSLAEYEELVSCIGVSGNMSILTNGDTQTDISKVEFLRLIATNIVE